MLRLSLFTAVGHLGIQGWSLILYNLSLFIAGGRSVLAGMNFNAVQAEVAHYSWALGSDSVGFQLCRISACSLPPGSWGL